MFYLHGKDCILDILWGQQPIKPIQVVFTSHFHENYWNDIVFIYFCPLHFVQGLRSKNIKKAITTLLFKFGKI